MHTYKGYSAVVGDVDRAAIDSSSSVAGTDKPSHSQTDEVNSKYTRDISKMSDSTSTLVELKKQISLWDGIGIIVGIMIGAGIFVTPGTVLKYTGSVGMSLVVWVVTGFMCMAGAFCYAELGTMIPKSGCEYAYVLEAFGSVPGFLILWIHVLIQRPGSRAINAITFANYLLQPIFPDCASPPYLAVRLIAAVMLCLITYINCVGVKLGTRIQDGFSVMKMLALFIIIVTGIHHLIQGHTENFQNPTQGTITDITSIATAFYSALYAFSGWNSLNSVTEELKDPYRNLPRAIAVSIVTVIVTYILVNIAYFAVLTPSEILSSSAVAVTFGNRTLGLIGWAISIFVACSTFGSTNGNIITQSRLMYVGARQGHLPHFLTLIHVRNLTPITSVACVIIVPLLMLLSPDIVTLLTYTSLTRNITDLLCALALLWLRYKEPDRPRPIKVWIGFPIIYLIMTTFIAVFPVVQRPFEIGVAMMLFIIGLFVYYIAIHLKIKVIGKAMDKVTYICQQIFLCVEQEKSN